MKKAEARAITRARLVRVARDLFAARGYAGAGTNDVVETAGVTRGALYYHFADKQALFEAVVEEVAAEIVESIESCAASAPDPIASIRLGSRGFFDACAREDIRRIFLLDAPAVLGWPRWREIDMAHAFGALRAGVNAIPHPGADPDAAALALSGAMNELVLWMADAPKDATRRLRSEATIDALIERLLS